MKKCLIILLGTALPTIATAQVDLQKAATLCLQHRHVANNISADGKPMPSHNVVIDPGWEHCTELLALKLKADQGTEQENIAATKRALEQLKVKQ